MRTTERTTLLRTLPLVAGLVLAAACGDDSDNGNSPTPCFSDLDCAPGETCDTIEFGVEGECIAASVAVCGDGTVDEGEECDDGNTTDGDGCEADCTFPREPGGECGDGTLNEGEECDDGNTTDGDGCEADCTDTPDGPVCGDGNLDDGEECDDGNDVDGDGCEADCTNTPGSSCGDGTVDDGEECDDGNDVDGDGCEADCTTTPEPFCGDGNLDEDEECDDGNDVDGDGCESDCTVTPEDVCGDDILGASEECDDGNTVDCDGCSAACEIDDCDTCGDGTLDEGEECDDGNTTSGDGCSESCQTEVAPYDGWVTWVVTDPPTLERVAVVAGDGSAGPFILPAGDTAFSRAQYPTFSPDGTKIAYIVTDSRTRLRVLDLATGEFDELFDGEFSALRTPRYSPDGEQFTFSAKTDEVDTWNIYTAPVDGSGSTAITFDTPEDTSTFYSAAEWSCDGTGLFYLRGIPGAGGTNDLYLANADGSGEVMVSPGITATSLVPSVNCTGVLLDSLGLSSPVEVDIATGAVTPFGIAGTDSNCSWYGDSDRVVCERESGPEPDFAPCDGGGASCVRDIVVLGADGTATINLTESIEARDNTPAASFQPYTELSVDGLD